MKFLIIVGSARKHGYSLEIANAIKENLTNDTNNSVEIFNIPERQISACLGCVKCCENENQYCVMQDEIVTAYRLMEEAESIIYISPIYECFISGTLKNFFDRTNHYTSFFKLAGKPINLILSGVQPLNGKTKEFSNAHVVKNINQYFKNYSIITHTDYHFLGFIQHSDHHSTTLDVGSKTIKNITTKLLKQRVNNKLIAKSQYTYSV